MAVSEARLSANRQNALKSSGPKTPEGKELSRRNSVKHGLSGSGVVIASEDAAEVERRTKALEGDLRPQSPLGQILLKQMAWQSVRMEQGARQELANSASRARHAIDEFDEARVAEASQLFEGLAEDPREILRKLRKSPEGVARIIDAWRELRDDLVREANTTWNITHVERTANLLGIRAIHARTSEIGGLWRGMYGDFQSLSDHEGGDLDILGRKAWAKDRLVERINAEIAALEAHRETINFETIELDRREAPERALFDPSKEANLARRYEAAANRGFFKALKEFRQAEDEFLDRAEAASTAEATEPVASFRNDILASIRDPLPRFQNALPDRDIMPKTPNTPQPAAIESPSRQVEARTSGQPTT